MSNCTIGFSIYLRIEPPPDFIEEEVAVFREHENEMVTTRIKAMVYRPVETIRAEFEAHHKDHQRVIAEFLSDTETQEEEFWQKAKSKVMLSSVEELLQTRTSMSSVMGFLQLVSKAGGLFRLQHRGALIRCTE